MMQRVPLASLASFPSPRAYSKSSKAQGYERFLDADFEKGFMALICLIAREKYLSYYDVQARHVVFGRSSGWLVPIDCELVALVGNVIYILRRWIDDSSC